ncbi:MAG: PsbP-related protein [Candidatus Nealsonbacteria bacterium]|nr:PsbP-related protein [Candidatus Nealsonbacteria bacterium]
MDYNYSYHYRHWGILTWHYLGSKITETANLETYRNNSYGYEIKYPTNWKLDEGTPNNIIFRSCFIEEAKEECYEQKAIVEVSSEFYSLEEWVNKEKDELKVIFGELKNINFKEEEISISGGKGYKLIYQTTSILAPTWKIGVFWGGNLYKLTTGDSGYTSEKREVFPKMISSFRFIKTPEEVLTWNTYKNNKYKLKYPNGWSTEEQLEVKSVRFKKGSAIEMVVTNATQLVPQDPAYSSLENRLNTREVEVKKQGGTFYKKETTIGSERGYWIKVNIGGVSSEEIILFKNANLFIISFPFSYIEETPSSGSFLLGSVEWQRIFSSFRFIE